MDSGDDEYYYYSDEDEYSAGGGEKTEAAERKNDGDGDAMDVSEDGETANAPEARRNSSSSTSSYSAPPRSSLGNNPEEYRALDPDMVEEEQNKLVTDVSEVLDIDYDTSNVLLLHFNWNKEKLFDAYYADPEGVCAKTGAIPGGAESGEMGQAGSKDAPSDGDAAGGQQDFMCPIMYMDVPLKHTYAMTCGHRFSLDAWLGYLREKAEDGKECIFARCPDSKCKATVSPKTWEKLLTYKDELDAKEQEANARALKKYKRFLSSSFIEINRTMRYCPGKRCPMAIKSSGAVSNVKCSHCGTLFCFKCGSEAHAPTSCAWLAQWYEKCTNESETANWILANTKKCPKCDTRIEKNQGCNHITCKVCKADFCWICMGDWAEHGTATGGYYNCNRWKSDGDGKDDGKDKAKRELERYLHYYKRYANHESAGKFATEQRESAERRMVEMQKNGSLGWVDVQFILQAVEQLIDCRRVLKNTYIHAYYLPDGAKKELFEYLQSMLEKNTERLSELSEQDVEKMDRAEVINYTRVTGKFLNNLLEEVDAEGIGIDNDDAAAAEGGSSSSSSASAIGAAAPGGATSSRVRRSIKKSN